MEQIFIRKVAQAEIGISTKLPIDLDTLRRQFGNDFNTIFITNTDAASDISLYTDGQEIAFITANNGVFSFDWETGLTYNFIEVENKSAAAAIVADNIKIFVGRTGKA